ncbi:MAG: YfhO family protein [bacterium]|nr:YfhO family protein [bacterium]
MNFLSKVRSRIIPIFYLIAPYALLVLFAAIFFAEVLFKQKIFIHTGVVLSDLFLFNVPVKNLLYTSLLNRQAFPFWTDLIGNGYPIFAEGQIGAFNPVTIIFFFIPRSFYQLFNDLTVLYVILGGFSMYLFLKKSIHLSIYASLFGSLIFMFCGYMIANLHHINVIQVLYLFPLNLFFIEKLLALKRSYLPTLKFIGGLVVLIIVQFGAGHIESLYYSVLFCAVYAIIRLFFEAPIRNDILLKILIVSSAVVISLLLMSIQILSTYELVSNSVRQQGVTYDYSTSQTWPLETLQILFNPKKYPLYIDGMVYKVGSEYTHLNWLYIYIGILPLIGIIFSLASLFSPFSRNSKQKQWILVFLSLLGVSYIYAIGASTQLFTLLWKIIPGMSMFRYQTKVIYFFQFSLVVLSAIGFEAFFVFLRPKLSRKFFVELLLSILIISTTFVDLYLNNKSIQPVATATDWLSEPPMVTEIRKQMCTEKPIDCSLTYSSRIYSRGSDVIDKERVFDYALQKDLRNNLYSDYNILYSIPLNAAYSGLPLKQHQLMNSYDTAINPATGEMVIPGVTQRIMDLQSVQFLITHLPLESSGYSLKKQFRLQASYPQRLPVLNSQEIKTFSNDFLYTI